MPKYVSGLCIINVYYIFISVIVCSVSVILRLTVFLTLKQKWQVFKEYMMSILLHLVTKHGIYNLISHKRRAVIIPACQKGSTKSCDAERQLQSSSLFIRSLSSILSRAPHDMRGTNRCKWSEVKPSTSSNSHATYMMKPILERKEVGLNSY